MPSATHTGIDIGSTAIRVVETSRGRGKREVANFAQGPLPAGAVIGGLISEPAAVTATLKKLWSEHKFKNKKVVLGVTGSQILVREITLPKLPAKQLKQTLPFQVRELLPMPVENALLDFYPLSESEDGTTLHGLVVAAPKENVLAMIRAVERAGLQVARVDLASFAILRSAAMLSAPVEALVDLGAHASTIVVHADGRPLIVRTVPRGGHNITEAIAERLGIPTEQAEALKCRFGLERYPDHQTGQAGVSAQTRGSGRVGNPAQTAVSVTKGGVSRKTGGSGKTEGPGTTVLPGLDEHIGKVADIIAEALRPLISEIRNSFAYVKSVDDEARVANLALTGGGAMLPGLVERLHSELDVDVLIADPLQRLNELDARGKHNELARYRSSAAISVGLTLGAAS